MIAATTPRAGGRSIPTLIRRLDRWLLSPAPAQRLAALRILVGGFVLIYLIAAVADFARVSRLPTEQFEPIGVAGLLDRPVSPTVVWVFFGCTMVAGVAFVAGAMFRVSGPAFATAVLIWASYHSSWGQMLHFEHLFTLNLWVIGLSPSADAWSARRRGPVDPSVGAPAVRYGWPVRLLAIITATTYVIAGLTKLRTAGLEWVDTTTLGNHIAYSATRMELLGARRPPLASLVVGRPWLVAPMASAALLIELAAPIALLGRRWRNGWVLAAFLMHLGTAATMFVWFPFHGLGFAFLPLFATERVVGPVVRRLSRSPR